MSKIKQLIKLLKGEDVVYIQTHDFPDNDAISSAFGMQKLLDNFGIASYIIYEGSIQRDSLKRMIEALEIKVYPAAQSILSENDKIVVVDGCKGNKNVSDLQGEEVAVIDHHDSKAPEDVPFVDIRPEYGSSSTLVYTYFEELNIAVDQKLASALMLGLLVDTARLTRGLSKIDVLCYAELMEKADTTFVNRMLRNNIQKVDLEYYRRALDKTGIQNRFAFCYFEEGCKQNLLGIIADFFLAVQEVNFVFLCARNGDHINLSLRSEDPSWNAAEIIRIIMGGIVFGSGHANIAGGVIEDADQFDRQKCFDELQTLLAERVPKEEK
jgi:nanoRNase/pAp phosphatase (c-di-AMP/oligoRNAs hydrolase)